MDPIPDRYVRPTTGSKAPLASALITLAALMVGCNSVPAPTVTALPARTATIRPTNTPFPAWTAEPSATPLGCDIEQVEALQNLYASKLDIGYLVPPGLKPVQEYEYDFNNPIGSAFLLQRGENLYAVSVFHVVGSVGGAGHYIYGQEIDDIEAFISLPGADPENKMAVPFTRFKGAVDKVTSVNPFAPEDKRYSGDGVYAAELDLTDPKYAKLKELIATGTVQPYQLPPDGYAPSGVFAVPSRDGKGYQVIQAPHGYRNGLFTHLVQAEQPGNPDDPRYIQPGSSGGPVLDMRCDPKTGKWSVTPYAVGTIVKRGTLNPVGITVSIIGQLLGEAQVAEIGADLAGNPHIIEFIPLTSGDIK